MNTLADKTQENTSRTVTNEIRGNHKLSESTLQFMDNRPEAIAQKKSQEMANSSSRVVQLISMQETANRSRQSRQAIQMIEDRNLRPGVIQRRLDLSRLGGSSILENAINIFHEIESDDITRDEFEYLKNERQRFMPLFGRFSLAKNTTLRVCPATKSQVGDMAVTTLSCTTNNGQTFEYDTDQAHFMGAIGERSINHFVINVLFWNKRVMGEESTENISLKNIGTILQAFTHEMSVHAENMLDFTEDYWEYHNGTRDDPPSLLGTPTQEHAAFKQGQVRRYEYMSRRVKDRGGKIGQDFERREADDKSSAQ